MQIHMQGKRTSSSYKLVTLFTVQAWPSRKALSGRTDIKTSFQLSFYSVEDPSCL